MDVKPVEHGRQVHRVARQLGLIPSDILDFRAKSHPLGMPESVRQLLDNALDDTRFGPESSTGAVERALADRYGAPAASVLVSNGAAAAIDLALRAMAPNRVWIMAAAFNKAVWRGRLTVVSPLLQRLDCTPPGIADTSAPGRATR